jgi:hypothetical protein
MHTLHQQGDQGWRLRFLGSLGFACSPILSVSFRGMGREPVLNLSANSDVALSIICTVIDKTIFSTLWEKLMCVSYATDWTMFSRASRRCSSYNLSLGSFYMVDLRLWDTLSWWRSSWRVFTRPMCMPIIFLLNWALQLMYVYDQLFDHYIIKRHVNHAW